MLLKSDITANITELDSKLKPDKSFDVIRRDIIVGERVAALYFIDGFIKE